MMVSFLQALLNILQSELAKMDKMSQAGNGEATEKGKNK
jgi:hypothetical protein